MILVIDNHDSFVHNLARLIRVVGGHTRVVRNDRITAEEAMRLPLTGIVLSPGPGRAEDAGVCLPLIEKASHLTIMGVCLGHQAIIDYYGGSTVFAKRPMHGRACHLQHDGSGLFQQIASPMRVGRYHSLVGALPQESPLVIQARSQQADIMACRHQSLPHHGVQFHPESVLTEGGKKLLENFVALTKGTLSGG